MHSRPTLDRFDWLLMLGLAVLTGLYALAYIDFACHPFEDAAMLMRYSLHLAQGHGIVWNVGERPVDGGTDFLLVLLLAGVVKAGLPIESATRLVGFLAHLLTAVIVYAAVRRLHGSPRWMAAASAAYLAVGPGMGYVAAYFGTPFFALFACVTWCLAIALSQAGGPHAAPVRSALPPLFALSALVMGLIRPEGVFLAGLMMISIIYLNGLRASRLTIVYFVAVFACIGGAYFAWRWHYFGHPLPNPFYKKGGGQLHLASLAASIKNTAVLCFPFIFAFIVGLRSRKTLKQTVFALIPILGFVALWVLVSDEMNYLRRFQYPILPVVLLSWTPLVRGLVEEWRGTPPAAAARLSRTAVVALFLLTLAAALAYQHRIAGGKLSRRDGRYDVAVMLSEYADRDYTLATTEAGLLPLYSRWRAIDTWGLNDPWIAHRGAITEDYLSARSPHLIMFHARFSPISPATGEGRWFSMVTTVQRFAEERGYLLAAAFGDSPYDTHYYYVRPDFADAAEIASRIRGTDYFWYVTGRRCIDYAGVERPGGW